MPMQKVKSKSRLIGHVLLLCLSAMIILCSSPRASAAKSPEKLLSAKIKLDIDWNYEGGALGHGEHGQLRINIHGKLALNKQFSSVEQGLPAVMLPYKTSSMRGRFIYKNTIKESEECYKKFDTSGGFNIKAYPGPGNLMLHYMGGMSEQLSQVRHMAPDGAFDTLIDRYMFGVTIPAKEVKGQKVCRGKTEQISREVLGNKIEMHFKFNDDGSMSGSRTWSSKAYPLISSVSVSNLPEVFKAKPYSPARETSGEVNYKLSWEVKEPQGVQIFRLDPNDPHDPGEDITDQEQEIYVGEKIKLEALVYPEPKGQSESMGEWTIPGKVLKDWEATHAGSTKTEIPGEDYRKQEIEFFWFDAEEKGVEQKIVFKPNNREATGKTTFRVKRPDYSLYCYHPEHGVPPGSLASMGGLAEGAGALNYFHRGPMQIGLPLEEAKCCVSYTREEKEYSRDCQRMKARLEEMVSNGDPESGGWTQTLYEEQLREYKQKCQYSGIQYQGIIFISRPFSGKDYKGELQYVQLIKINKDNLSKTASWGLDGCYPYPMHYPPYSTSDYPAFSDPGPGKSRHRDLSFKMYLMYRPEPKYKDAHAWVPIKRVDWGWGGKIACDAGGECRHVFEADRVTPNARAKEQREYPEWDTCH